MNLPIDRDTIIKRTKPALSFLKKYGVFACILIFLGIYAFLVLRISSFTQADPNPAQVAADQDKTGSLKIDQKSISRINELEDQNVDTKAIFKQARDNPFSE